MYWDPEVESPASIAVIGAGPVGIEAALYARYLGYDVDLYDVGRPARALTRWHDRSLDVTIAECTTPLGHAALHTQDHCYRRPSDHQRFTGQQYADDYLIPLAKSDLLIDGVHINSTVTEVGRRRSSLDTTDDLQERCNDEFRLVIQSRDRGIYSTRADIVLDCRGLESGASGTGPGGGLTIGYREVEESMQRWLPRDPRFENRQLAHRQTLLFGQSERAILFADEWSEWARQSNRDSAVAGESQRELPRLLWLIPSWPSASTDRAIRRAEELTRSWDDPRLFSFLLTLGIEQLELAEGGTWKLQLLQPDDSQLEVRGDVFAPYPAPRSTPPLGPQLLSQRWGFDAWKEDRVSPADNLIYPDWPGWRVATYEPHYYVLGSRHHPHTPKGLSESYQQIVDLFALLGGRADLNLYEHARAISSRGFIQ